MATYENQTLQDQRALGWPIVVFFVLAYAIAWGAFGILSVIARNSGVESTQTFMAMAESFEFDEVHLSVAPWLVYLLTRLADFAFSIAGVVMIAATAGRGACANCGVG